MSRGRNNLSDGKQHILCSAKAKASFSNHQERISSPCPHNASGFLSGMDWKRSLSCITKHSTKLNEVDLPPPGDEQIHTIPQCWSSALWRTLSNKSFSVCVQPSFYKLCLCTIYQFVCLICSERTLKGAPLPPPSPSLQPGLRTSLWRLKPFPGNTGCIPKTLSNPCKQHSCFGKPKKSHRKEESKSSFPQKQNKQKNLPGFWAGFWTSGTFYDGGSTALFPSCVQLEVQLHQPLVTTGLQSSMSAEKHHHWPSTFSFSAGS